MRISNRKILDGHAADRDDRGVSIHLRNRLTLLCSCIVVCMLLSQTGCQLFRRASAPKNLAPVLFPQTPSQQQLLGGIANNARRVRQLSSTVKINMDGAPKLKGSLQLERPRRLRVKAGLLGVSELGVDVGSNDDLFWVWTKVNLPNQRPAIFYAAHEAFRRSNSHLRQAIPLEPVWLIEALGLIEFEPGDVHKGPFPTPEGRLRLLTTRMTPRGPQTRVSLVNRQGLIEQQSMYDADNQLIAYSNSLEYKTYASESVSLPQKIEMHVFQQGQDVKMIVESGDYQINSLYGDPQRMWAMPDPRGVEKIDIAE